MTARKKIRQQRSAVFYVSLLEKLKLFLKSRTFLLHSIPFGIIAILIFLVSEQMSLEGVLFSLIGSGFVWSGFVLGALAGKKTERLPMFTVSLLTIVSFLLLCVFSDSTTLGMITLVVVFLVPYLISFFISSIITFLRSKHPPSPFLLVRLYQKIPFRFRPYIQIAGIIAGTGLLLLLIFKGEEIPKFAYNYLEYPSFTQMMIIAKQSDDIDALIERKRNIAVSPALIYDDALSMTDAYMQIFEKQKQSISAMNDSFTTQSKIPFLPERYQMYHQLKMNWIDAYTRSFTVFYEIKTLEKQIADLLIKLNDAQTRIYTLSSVDTNTISVQLYAAIALSKEIQKTLDEMRKDQHLTEDMEDYFALETKRVIDMATLILDASVPEDEMDIKYQEIEQRGLNIEFMPIYGAWRAAIIDPMEEDKNTAYKEADRLFLQIIDEIGMGPIFRDEITPFAKKLNLLPKYDDPLFDKDPLPITESEMDDYALVYKDPFVMHIRTVLDSYLAGETVKGVNQQVLTTETNHGLIYGLDFFDKAYYKSKFVVLTINDNDTGGKNINIQFQDKPDRYFYVRVDKNEDGTYEMMNFSSDEVPDAEKIKRKNIEFKQFLEDKEHAL